MLVDLYPSASDTSKFLAVPAQTDLRVWKPSGDFDKDLRQVRPLRSTEDYQRGQTRVAVSTDQVLDDIARQGWALVEVSMTVTVGK